VNMRLRVETIVTTTPPVCRAACRQHLDARGRVLGGQRRQDRLAGPRSPLEAAKRQVDASFDAGSRPGNSRVASAETSATLHNGDAGKSDRMWRRNRPPCARIRRDLIGLSDRCARRCVPIAVDGAQCDRYPRAGPSAARSAR
jgi:hypothetical protein